MGECPGCGAPKREGLRFCAQCGTALALVCPACGNPHEPGDRFCGGCGADITSGGRQEIHTVAERRVCSVLFCDVVGFTPLSESRDAEAVRELLSQYFDTARTVISRYGGVVEKFIGDAVMAVWGAPVAVEGDTERAVRAGLELVDAVAALGEQVGAAGLAARAGVVTGEVAVTLGATQEGMVAGDAVNTAARVQSVASAGSVWVDDATRRLAQAGVEFVDVGEHALKGKAEPLRLWRAGRVLSNVGGAQRVDGLQAPITGRDVELRLLKDLFHAAADRRQPRLVAVTGPAGVGKSRLGWEFEKYVDGLAALVRWHRGRCLSYGDGVAFWALAEIVRQRLDIAEDDPIETATAKLAAGLEQWVPDPDERGYVGVRLGRLLGLRLPGDTGQELNRDELFAGWRLWFERLADAAPVVLLVEDLHHADSGLLDFLDHLLDWARNVPVFVLTFSRPETRLERPGWGVGRNRTLLTLDPLDAASMTGLLQALVPGVPPVAASAIAAQAQGIPLFAVETIRALIDRDIVVPVEGVYRLVGDLGRLTVPDSLHGLLAARLDALDPDVRALVADAAVLGDSFAPEALAAVSARPENEIRAALSDLVRREVFEIAADPLSPQRGNYGFAHDMLRQVAYDTLSRRDRKIRHLAVAAHLRATYPGDGDEIIDVIARHYLDALTAVPDDADNDDLRAGAVEALTRAGERAARTGAARAAADHFAAAAHHAAAAQSPDRDLAAARLWERAAAAGFGSGHWATIVDYADHAITAYGLAGHTRAAARTQSLAGRAARAAGRFSEARDRLTIAIAELSDNPDADTIMAMSVLAALETFAGAADADRLTDDALALGQELGVSRDILAELLITRASWHVTAGHRAQAVAYLREAVRLAEEVGDMLSHSRALLNISDALTATDARAAAQAARDAADVARRAGNRQLVEVALSNLVVSQLQTGEWQEAMRIATEAIESDGLDGPFITINRATIALLRGDADTAQPGQAALSDVRASEDPQDQATVALFDATVAAAHNRPADALRQARAALDHIDALGPSADSIRWSWPIAARAAHQLGDTAEVSALLALLDRYQPGHLPPMLHAERDLTRARLAVGAGTVGAEADALFSTAVASLRERGTPYHLANGLLDHADHLVATGHRSEADALIEEARQIAGQLGAKPLAERAATIAGEHVATSPAR